MDRAFYVGKLPPALPARRIPSISQAQSQPEAASAGLPARLPPLTPPLFRVSLSGLLSECLRSLNKLSQGAGCQRLHSGALPPLSAPASGESIAMRRPIHPCTPLRAPRSPLLALNPNPLTPLCASPAQDLDDFLSSAARGSGSGRDSQSLDLGWCLRCFYFNYCML